MRHAVRALAALLTRARERIQRNTSRTIPDCVDVHTESFGIRTRNELRERLRLLIERAKIPARPAARIPIGLQESSSLGRIFDDAVGEQLDDVGTQLRLRSCKLAQTLQPGEFLICRLPCAFERERHARRKVLLARERY